MIDALDIDRDITVRKIPAGDTYWFSGETVTVTWHAVSRKAEGGYDVADCTYDLKIKGNSFL